jgi:8-oxo-dGTP pyrophosphatase MutT (NUDIX family)
MAEDARFSVAAYAVVTNDRDEVLLTSRRGGGEWVLPGGSVEAGEAPLGDGGREVCEETGLEIGDVRLAGVYAKRSERDLVFLFGATVVRGSPRSSDERDLVEFVDSQQPPQGTSVRDRERIRDALAAGPGPLLRVQPSDADEPPPGTR